MASLLGTDSIPAGTGLELRVTLDPQAEPDVLSVTYYLRGKSADGHPVVGSFSVMRPPPAPNADNSTPVTDPQLAAKIRLARERLGKRRGLRRRPRPPGTAGRIPGLVRGLGPARPLPTPGVPAPRTPR